MQERIILIIFIISLNALFWVAYLKSFEETTKDGAVGKAFIGMIFLVVSLVILFNLKFLV